MLDFARRARWMAAVPLAFLTLACVSEPAPANKTYGGSTAKPTVSVSTGDKARTPRAQTPSNANVKTMRPEDALGSAGDPCAERLHAISGSLLFYYAIHKKLPAKIEELRDITGPDPDVEFTCPLSGKPYVYNPRGLPHGDQPGYLVIYDPEPSHNGFRWAISVEEPRNTAQKLVTRVIPEPEATFRDQPLVPPTPLAPAQAPAPAPAPTPK